MKKLAKCGLKPLAARFRSEVAATNVTRMSNFILVCMEGVTADGVVVSEDKIAARRMHAKRWPLFARTKHRSEIDPGSRVLVYVGGQQAWGQSFVATATVLACDQVDRTRRRHPADTSDDAVEQQVVAWLRLAEVRPLRPAREMRDLLDRLSFIPENRSRWGVSFMGGVRRISDEDWNAIVSAVPSGWSSSCSVGSTEWGLPD